MRYTTTVLFYQLILIPKFCGVLLFAGGLGAAFSPLTLVQRKLAVHRVASFGLLLTWLCGLGAAEIIGLAPSELWIIASLVLSTLAQGVLVWSVLREGRRTPAVFAAAVLPLALTLVFMVVKPTWAWAHG